MLAEDVESQSYNNRRKPQKQASSRTSQKATHQRLTGTQGTLPRPSLPNLRRKNNSGPLLVFDSINQKACGMGRPEPDVSLGCN